MSQWYPLESLGAMYVHTNYNSFLSNAGSFGAIDSSIVNDYIKSQGEREEKIDTMLKEVFGNHANIDEFMELIKNWQNDYKDSLEKVYIDDVEFLKSKTGNMPWSQDTKSNRVNITSIAHGIKKEHVDMYFELLLDNIEAVEKLTEKMVEQGVGNKEIIASHIKDLKTRVGNMQDIKAKGNNVSLQRINSFKGILKEAVDYCVLSAIHNAMIDGFSEKQLGDFFNLELVGARGSPGADIVAELKDGLNVFKYGFNIKSSSQETFKGEKGISLYEATSIENFINHLNSFKPLKELESLKYYLINISRMSSSSLTGGEGKAGTIQDIQGGYELLRSVVNTYATLFIGENTSDMEEHEIRQADFLVLKEAVYKKSEIMKNILQNEDVEDPMSILFQFDSKAQSPSQGWDHFDNRKRQLMWHYNDYSVVARHPFMVSPVSSILQRAIKIRLKLLK